MTSKNEQDILHAKIIAGLDKVYEKLIAYKKQKKSVIVILKDHKIVHIKP